MTKNQVTGVRALRGIVRVRRTLKELGYEEDDVMGALDDLRQLRAKVRELERPRLPSFVQREMK